MTHGEWLDQLPGNPSISAAARAAGIQKTTLIRQLDRGEISAENVVALARAHNANEIDALIETGYVDPEALAGAGIPQALAQATNRQILDEITQRMDPEAVRMFKGADDAEVITPRFGADVAPLRDDLPSVAYEGEVDTGTADDDIP